MKRISYLLAVTLAVFASPNAKAEARILAEREKTVPRHEVAIHAWPAFALEFMAHPSREVIWKNTGEGKFGDRVMISFRPKSVLQVNEVLAIFAKSNPDYPSIVLYPEKEPARFVASYPKSFRGCSMLVTVRSPKALKAWYENLPINAEGLRYSPLQVFTEPPQAGFQSFQIFVGQESIVLDDITWPEWAVLVSGTSKEARKETPEDPDIIAIDRMAARHSLPDCMARRARRAEEGLK